LIGLVPAAVAGFGGYLVLHTLMGVASPAPGDPAARPVVRQRPCPYAR
jgi:hypothetical protein